MRILTLTLLSGAILAAPALADPPPIPCIISSLDSTMRLLLIPDENGADPHPAASFTVTILDENCETPYVGLIVEVLIAGQAGNHVRLCGNAVITGTTDAQGSVRFNIGGGGCFKGPAAVTIRANGVTIRQYDAVMSPDYAGADNAGIPGRWSLSITPVDLGAFVASYQGGTGGASCHDYNNNGTVDPVDLSVFASAYAGGARDCSP